MAKSTPGYTISAADAEVARLCDVGSGSFTEADVEQNLAWFILRARLNPISHNH